MNKEGHIFSQGEKLDLAVAKKPRFFYGYTIIAAAFFIELLAWGTYATFGVFFISLSADFGWTRAMTSSPRSLSFLLIGLLGIVVGRLTDKLGPRLVMTVCGFFLGLGYLLMSQLNTIWYFYLFYGFIIAAGMSGADVSLLSTSARWFVKKRGMVSGILKSGAGVGMAVMPLVAQWLISSYGWRTAYIVIGSTVLVIGIAAAQFLRRDPGQMRLLPDGVKVEEENPKLEITKVPFSEAIRTSQFWMLSLAYLLALVCTQTIMVHLYAHVVDLGIAPATAANVLAVIGGVSLAGRFILGSAADRMGNKWAIAANFIVLLASLVWLQLSGEVWMFYLFAAIYGFAHGGLYTLISPAIAELFGLSSLGVILGMVTFISTIGGTFSPIIAGHIFDTTGSYQSVFMLLIAASAGALVLVLLLRPTKRSVAVLEI